MKDQTRTIAEISALLRRADGLLDQVEGEMPLSVGPTANQLSELYSTAMIAQGYAAAMQDQTSLRKAKIVACLLLEEIQHLSAKLGEYESYVREATGTPGDPEIL